MKRITYGDFVQSIEVYIQWTNLEKTTVTHTHTHTETREKEVRKCPKYQKRQHSIALSMEADLNFTSMHFYCAFKTPSGAVKYNWHSLHSVLIGAHKQAQARRGLSQILPQLGCHSRRSVFPPHQGPSRSFEIL